MKKMAKYAPAVYATWTNPAVRAKIVQTAQGVSVKVEEFSRHHSNLVAEQGKVDNVDAKLGTMSKADKIAVKIPAGVVKGAAKASSSAANFLATQHAKASAAGK